MAMRDCAFCERPTQFKRNIGVGSLLLVILTAGFWIFAIPFYSPRCSICSASQTDSGRHQRKVSRAARKDELVHERIAAEKRLEEERGVSLADPTSAESRGFSRVSVFLGLAAAIGVMAAVVTIFGG